MARQELVVDREGRMQQLKHVPENTSTGWTRSPTARVVVGATIGAVLGLVIGIVVTAGVAVWAIAAAADRGETVVAEPIITVNVTDTDAVEATSGPGIATPAIAGVVIGGGVGAALAALRRSSKSRG